MTELLYCLSCNAILDKYNLRRLQHIELQCPECGEWSEYDYAPENYVFKSDE